MSELHASPEAAEAALRREWAAKGHDRIYVENVVVDEPQPAELPWLFGGRTISVQLSHVDPEVLALVTNEWNDGMETEWQRRAEVGETQDGWARALRTEHLAIKSGLTKDDRVKLGVTVDENRGVATHPVAAGDPWANLSTYSCSTCRFFVPKREADGRCRRHAPTMDGYPVVYPADWCGDHKLGTNPSRET